MKIDFVIPSWSYWEEPTRAQPLTALYLATILEDEGHEVVMTDFRDGPKTLPEADVHMYTVASPDFEEVRNIVANNPGVHIAGGPHPTIFPDESLEVFDAIAIGKGEESIKQMVRDLGVGKLERKYILGTKGKYPFPKRHFLPKEKIVTSLFKTEDIPSTTVLFSHGCPFACTFCANYDRGAIQNRSVDDIQEEIDYLKSEYGIEGVSLQDEICFPPGTDVYPFLKMMKDSEMSWRGQTRGGTSEQVIEKAAESGCIELSFGLESVCQDTLDLTKKAMKVETVKKSIALCKDYGIRVRLYLLNGLPGEPEDIVQQTKDFIGETEPDVVLLSTLQPYPGSEIYNHPERFNMKIIDRNWSNYNHLRCRFADSQDTIEDAVPFEYEDGFSRNEIMTNLVELQGFLREKGLNK